MIMTSRTALINRKTNTRDPKIYVIVPEGAATERAYFEAFVPAPAARAPFKPSPVVVKVLPPLDHHSSPRDLLKTVRAFVREQKLDLRDEVWLVFDVDRWPLQALAKVCGAARRGGFRVAVSNPCFEVWLCLHLAACRDEAIAHAAQNHGVGRSPGRNLKNLLRETLGSYNEARPDPAAFHPHLERAIERARARDDPAQQHWPPAAGSRVYELVESLMAALQS